MPIYEYECKHCDFGFETSMDFSTYKRGFVPKCPLCSSNNKVKKKMSLPAKPIYRGEGFTLGVKNDTDNRS